MSELKTRQKNILRWIAQSYIDTASPVGSRHLAKKHRLNCSAATIRNEMADLEEMGYIRQPHTSAGRVPTDKGYRFYVDILMMRERLSPQECERIHGRMEKTGGDVNLFLEEVSRILGKISQELSVVLTPWISWGIFDRLELVGITQKKVLVVIHVQSRLVKTLILEVESDLKREDLEETASFLNERLSGLTLEEIQRTIGDRVQNTGIGSRILMHRIVKSASDIFDFSEPLEVHTCGTQDILTQPEFSDISMLKRLLSLIDDRRGLVHLFHRKVNETEVTIGQENKDRRLQSFTVVAACYTRGRDVGALGVIGPTRMPYRKILPLVNYTANTISQFFS